MVLPAVQNQYNVTDWSTTTNADGSGLTITGYTGTATTDFYIPNSGDFRTAGKINDTQKVYITTDLIKDLVRNKPASSITIDPTTDDKNKLVAAAGSWQCSFSNSDLSSSNPNYKTNTTLKSVDVTGLDTSKVDNFMNMFMKDAALTTITGIGNWDVSHGGVFGHMFADCTSLTSLDLTNWRPSSGTWMDNMFLNDANLTSVGDLSNWPTSTFQSTASMFENTKKLASVGDLSGWRLPNVINSSKMFRNMYSITNLGNLDHWGMGKDTTMEGMFSQMYRLTNVGNLGSWNTANVTSMQRMFDGDISLATPGDLSGWNTSNVTSMGQMFRSDVNQEPDGDKNLFNELFSIIGTKVKVNDTTYTLGKLNSVGDLSNWDVSKVTNMAGMFEGTQITNIGDISGWHPDNLVDTDYMFYGTPYLDAKWDLSNWNQSGKLETTYRMFEGSGIRNVNVSNWKFIADNQVTGSTGSSNRHGHVRIDKMFKNLSHPATITINNWQNVPAALTTDDISSDQPMIIISSDTVDADHFNQVGHKPNTITYVAKSEPTKPLDTQQQDWVFKDEAALNAALNKIPTVDSWGNDTTTVNGENKILKDVAQNDSGQWLNGKHNATGVDYDTAVNGGVGNNYSKIAGTYSITGQTENVTANNNYKQQSVDRVFNIIEKLPGQPDKVVWTLDTTQYREATYNKLTGKTTYGRYVDQSGSGSDPYNKYNYPLVGVHNGFYPDTSSPDITASWGHYDNKSGGYTTHLPAGISPIHITFDYHGNPGVYQIDVYWGSSEQIDEFPKSQDFYITYTGKKPIKYVNADNPQDVVKTDEFAFDTANNDKDGKQPFAPSYPAGWVPDQNVPTTISSTIDPLTIEIKHGTVEVEQPTDTNKMMPNNSPLKYPKITKENLNKTLTRTITITKPDGTTITKTQSLSFKRKATIDTVTGDVTYGDWTPVETGNDSFTQVDVPGIQGYTPTQSDVPGTDALTQDQINNWVDEPTNITYTPNEQHQKVDFVDGNGNVIGSIIIDGKTGERVRVQLPAGYVMANGQEPIITITPDGKVIILNVVKLAQGGSAAGARANTHADQNKLPQTGNAYDASLMGLGIATMAGMLGLTGYKKREN